MTDNFDLMEINEANIRAMGGTEITTRQVYDGTIPRELLQNFQIIPSRIRELKSNKIRVLWHHNMPNDPESIKLKDKSYRDQFHAMVFSSDYQYSLFQMILGIGYKENYRVIESGIVPGTPHFSWKARKAKKLIHIAYTSTPNRGLGILVPVFAKIAETDKNIHLHAFSSFSLYGWSESDKPYEELFDQIRAHPQMTLHGAIPNDQLRDYLDSDIHIHAYPCIWIETLCRAVMEAMSAGCLCVHPNLGALPYTGAGFCQTYAGDTDPPTHASIFQRELEKAIGRWRGDDIIGELSSAKRYIDYRYNIRDVQQKWADFLAEMVERYPTPESRALPTENFTYRF